MYIQLPWGLASPPCLRLGIDGLMDWVIHSWIDWLICVGSLALNWLVALICWRSWLVAWLVGCLVMLREFLFTCVVVRRFACWLVLQVCVSIVRWCVCACVCWRAFFVALLYESPGGNQVDGLPPALNNSCRAKMLSCFASEQYSWSRKCLRNWPSHFSFFFSVFCENVFENN